MKIPKLVRNTVTGGLLGGIACLLMFVLVNTFSGKNPLSPYPIRLMDFWVPGFAIVFTLWYFKFGRPMQIFHIWEGLLGGLIVNIVTALTSATLLALYLNNFRPDLLTDYIRESIAYMNTPELRNYTVGKFGQEFYKASIKGLSGTKVSDIWVDDFGRKIFYGIFVILLASVILRKREPQLENLPPAAGKPEPKRKAKAAKKS
ncbi:MAG: DUF4199 domain-containing protein [Bacteroidota bacterium]